MRLLTTAITFFLFHATSSAQFSANTTVDSARLMIGDQLKLHLEVVHSAGGELMPLVLQKKEGDVVEFLGQTKWDTVAGGTTVRLQKDLLFTAWDSGLHNVPSIPIIFHKNGSRDTAYTERISIEVMAPEADSILADIKPIIEEPVYWTDYLVELAAVGLLLFMALLLFVVGRFKSKKKEELPALSIVPAHVKALEKLAMLKGKKLWQQGEVKAFHSELTRIIREYLENRYGIQALEQTTNEILDQMKNLSFDQNLVPKMTQLLQTADLVKFAKAEPPSDYHVNALALGEEFVWVTRKEDPEPKEEKENG